MAGRPQGAVLPVLLPFGGKGAGAGLFQRHDGRLFLDLKASQNAVAFTDRINKKGSLFIDKPPFHERKTI